MALAELNTFHQMLAPTARRQEDQSHVSFFEDRLIIDNEQL